MIKNRKAGKGWISYLRKGGFYTKFGMKRPPNFLFTCMSQPGFRIARFLSSFPVLYVGTRIRRVCTCAFGVCDPGRQARALEEGKAKGRHEDGTAAVQYSTNNRLQHNSVGVFTSFDRRSPTRRLDRSLSAADACSRAASCSERKIQTHRTQNAGKKRASRKIDAREQKRSVLGDTLLRIRL